MDFTEDSQQASATGSPRLPVSGQAVEFRYAPITVLQSALESLAHWIFVTFVIYVLVVFTVSSSWTGTMSPLCIAALLAPVGIAAVIIWAYQRRAFKRTGSLRIDYAGLWLPARESGDKNARILLPWSQLRQADALAGTGERLSSPKLQLTFDEPGLSADAKQVAELYGQAGGTIELDLRAILQRDRIRVLNAVSRFAPSARQTAGLGDLRQMQHAVSYTELWLESLTTRSDQFAKHNLASGEWLNDCRYEITRVLGSGGQGTAYEAFDQLSTGPNGAPLLVVLKEFILPAHANYDSAAVALAAVEREFEIMRRLDRKFIPQCFELFVEAQRVYLVREFVEGKSLKELVDENGPLELSAARDMALAMCDILAHLHSQSPPVIHHDFTPENLILTPTGDLKLIDFDVAHQTEQMNSGQVVGKPNYLAPEQFRGQSTIQSDIYSLGATLYFLLTGHKPTPISSSSPRLLNAMIPEGIDIIVQRATAIALQDRFQNAEEVKVELEGIAESAT